jgi:hypothetical protein
MFLRFRKILVVFVLVEYEISELSAPEKKIKSLSDWAVMLIED